MTNVALLALILIAIEGLTGIAVAVEGARRHLVGVNFEEELHHGPRR